MHPGKILYRFAENGIQDFQSICMPKILIIEDDPQMRQGLEEIFSGEGYSVSTAISGREALNLLEKEEFDIVLADVVMPHVGGLDVLKEVQKKWPSMPVVMVTAFATVKDAVTAMKEGASEYISKPFKIDEVQTAVRRVLEEARLRSSEVVARPGGGETLEKGSVIKALSNPIRWGALALLEACRGLRFTDLQRELGVNDASRLSYHLRELRHAELVTQDKGRLYVITRSGREAIGTARGLRRVNRWKRFTYPCVHRQVEIKRG